MGNQIGIYLVYSYLIFYEKIPLASMYYILFINNTIIIIFVIVCDYSTELVPFLVDILQQNIAENRFYMSSVDKSPIFHQIYSISPVYITLCISLDVHVSVEILLKRVSLIYSFRGGPAKVLLLDSKSGNRKLCPELNYVYISVFK